MVFERESVKPVNSPTAARLARELKRLKSHGKSSFASLTRDGGSYVQVAGGGVTCMVERRDMETRTQWRAFVRAPTVSFEDGTELVFHGGRIPLRRDEWLNVRTATDIFTAFLEGKPFPANIGWRDISEVVGLR